MHRALHATVMADRIETRYLRAGCGPIVVLLRPVEVPADGGLDPVVSALAGQFRIIVPELPPTVLAPRPESAGALSWLRGVLDGLGIHRVLLLVSAELSWLAAELRQEDPDRVQGIAIMVDKARAESVRSAVAGFFTGSMTT